MDADQQLARYGISAGAHGGQVVVTMNADLITLAPDEWRRWLFLAARALFDAKLLAAAGDREGSPA